MINQTSNTHKLERLVKLESLVKLKALMQSPNEKESSVATGRYPVLKKLYNISDDEVIKESKEREVFDVLAETEYELDMIIRFLHKHGLAVYIDLDKRKAKGKLKRYFRAEKGKAYYLLSVINYHLEKLHSFLLKQTRAYEINNDLINLTTPYVPGKYDLPDELEDTLEEVFLDEDN